MPSSEQGPIDLIVRELERKVTCNLSPVDATNEPDYRITLSDGLIAEVSFLGEEKMAGFDERDRSGSSGGDGDSLLGQITDLEKLKSLLNESAKSLGDKAFELGNKVGERLAAGTPSAGAGEINLGEFERGLGNPTGDNQRTERERLKDNLRERAGDDSGRDDGKAPPVMKILPHTQPGREAEPVSERKSWKDRLREKAGELLDPDAKTKF